MGIREGKKKPQTLMSLGITLFIHQNSALPGESLTTKIFLVFTCRQVFWLSDRPTRCAFPLPEARKRKPEIELKAMFAFIIRFPITAFGPPSPQWLSCSFRPRLQRRVRSRFARDSLLSPLGRLLCTVASTTTDFRCQADSTTGDSTGRM